MISSEDIIFFPLLYCLKYKTKGEEINNENYIYNIRQNKIRHQNRFSKLEEKNKIIKVNDPEKGKVTKTTVTHRNKVKKNRHSSKRSHKPK